MKTYEGKTVLEALKNASNDLNVPVDELKKKANIVKQVKSLMGNKVIIGIFNNQTVYLYATEYLNQLLAFLGASGTYTKSFNKETSMININIDTYDGSLVIGKNGETLKALNTLVRSACFNTFGGKYKILLNCGDYKENRYNKIIAYVRQLCQDVSNSGVAASLTAMPADERRMVHNLVLEEYPWLESVSMGEGRERHIVIRKK